MVLDVTCMRTSGGPQQKSVKVSSLDGVGAVELVANDVAAVQSVDGTTAVPVAICAGFLKSVCAAGFKTCSAGFFKTCADGLFKT